MDAHAFKATQKHRQEEAVKRIQAAYRGHQVRKSLHWNHQPTSSHQKRQIKHASTATTAGKQKSTTGTIKAKKPTKKTVLLEQQSKPTSGRKVTTPVTDKVAHKTMLEFDNSSNFSSGPTVVPPWEQTGGDEMSVINIYTRKYEKLQQQYNATTG